MSITGLAVLERVRREYPGLPVVSLLHDIDRVGEKLWRRRRWFEAASETSWTTVLSFATLTVVNGDATVVDAAAGGLFSAGHVGKHFTIDGVVYTVESITSGDSLELTAVYAGTSGSEAGTLPRVVYALPADFESLRKVRPEDSGYVYREPVDFILTGPDGDGAYFLDWEHGESVHGMVPGGDGTVVGEYWRKRTKSVGADLGVAVDVPVLCEEALVYGVVVEGLARNAGTTEGQMQLRVVRGQFEEAVMEALRGDGRRWSHVEARNARVLM